MRHWILNTAVFVIIVLTGSVVYLNSLHNGYHYDDIHHIVGNQYLTSIRNIPLFFTDSRTFSSLPEARNHYRPLLMTSYALNYYFGKLKPAGYHVVNLLFHAGSAFLIFLIVRAMVGPPPPIRGVEQEAPDSPQGSNTPTGRNTPTRGYTTAAIMAGMIFLTTPFNSEVVNYISARSSVMCTFFYLLAFYCWVKYRSPLPTTYYLLSTTYFYIASLLTFLLAMLTKEIAITLPVMLFVYDVYFRNTSPPHPALPHKGGGRKGKEGKGWRVYIPYVPFILVAGIAGFVLRKVVCGNIVSFGASSSRGPGTQFFTETRLILKYIYMTLVPVGLSVEHPVGLSSSLLEPEVLVSLIILMLIAGTLFLLWRSKDILYRSISFFGIWFFITMSPTAVIPLNAMFQENRGYLPGTAIVIVAGILLHQGIFSLRFSKYGHKGLHYTVCQGLHCTGCQGLHYGLFRGEKARPYIAYGLLAALIITYGGVTRDRNRVWKDDLTLWKDVEEKYPMSKNAGMELGRVHMAQDPAMGEEYLKEILLNEPRNTSVMNNLGNLYTNRGRYDLAKEMYLKAIEINPTDYKLHFNLAKVYKDMGNKEAAAGEYREVLKLAPDYTMAAELLAGLYVEMGKEEVIEGAFQAASGKDPANPAFHRGLGVTYARQQKWDMAIAAFKRVIEITPDDVQTRVDLGDSYMKTGRRDAAEREFLGALELDPDNRMANQGLGIIYQQQGRYEPALEHYEKAIQGRSPSPRVLNNIGSIYLAIGRTGKAIDAFREALRIDPSYQMARMNLERAYEAQRTVGSR